MKLKICPAEAVGDVIIALANVCPEEADAVTIRFLGKEVNPLLFKLAAISSYIMAAAIVLQFVGNSE